MTGMDEPTILVPVDVSDPTGTGPDPALVELLHPLRVVLLGYYPVPDQAVPEQLRDKYEEEATERIEDAAAAFEGDGGDVEAVVVFTRDRATSIDRLVAEYDCDVVLSPGAYEAVEQVLVPLRGDPIIEQIVSFVGALLEASDASVTLFHALDPNEDGTESEYMLRGAMDRLTEEGVDRERISWRQETSETPARAILTAGESHDVIVIGESEPSLKDRILGTVPNRIIDRSDTPVLVVLR